MERVQRTDQQRDYERAQEHRVVTKADHRGEQHGGLRRRCVLSWEERDSVDAERGDEREDQDGAGCGHRRAAGEQHGTGPERGGQQPKAERDHPARLSRARHIRRDWMTFDLHLRSP